MFIETCFPNLLSPVRAAFVVRLLQNTRKLPKLTPMMQSRTVPTLANYNYSTFDTSQRVTINADDKEASTILENQVDPNILPNTLGSKSTLYLGVYTVDEVNRAAILFIEAGEAKWRLRSDKPIC